MIEQIKHVGLTLCDRVTWPIRAIAHDYRYWCAEHEEDIKPSPKLERPTVAEVYRSNCEAHKKDSDDLNHPIIETSIALSVRAVKKTIEILNHPKAKGAAPLVLPIAMAGIHAYAVYGEGCPHLVISVLTVPAALTALYSNAIEPTFNKHERAGFNPRPLSEPK